jgi:hypothetical protein
MLREAVCGRAVTIVAYADRYAYTGCGSTTYSVGTVYGGKRDLHTPDARPASVATPCLASLPTPCSQAKAGPVCRTAAEMRPIRNSYGIC